MQQWIWEGRLVGHKSILFYMSHIFVYVDILRHWLTMVQDPGRQGFKDDVQRNGFLFLDDYLDNILSGAKQEYVPFGLPTTID